MAIDSHVLLAAGEGGRGEGLEREALGGELGGGSEDGRALPDFQSMLEAALRGDLGGDPGGDESFPGFHPSAGSGLGGDGAGWGRGDGTAEAPALGHHATPAAGQSGATGLLAPASPFSTVHPAPDRAPPGDSACAPPHDPRGSGLGVGRDGADARAAQPSAGDSDDLVFGASEDGDSWDADAWGARGRSGALPGGLFDEEEALDLEELRRGGSGGAAGASRGAAQLEGLGSGALQELGSGALHLDDAELLASLRALTGSRG